MNEREVEMAQRIGKRIREVRTQRGLSQATLAKEMGISLPHISDIELGKSNMMLTTFMRMLESLQVSADYLLLRPNIPEVRKTAIGEFSDILADCSPSEIESIHKIVMEMKSSFRKSELCRGGPR